MKNRQSNLLYMLFVFLPIRAFAHTGLESKEGIISNLIALGIVLFSILIFLIVTKKRKPKQKKKMHSSIK